MPAPPGMNNVTRCNRIAVEGQQLDRPRVPHFRVDIRSNSGNTTHGKAALVSGSVLYLPCSSFCRWWADGRPALPASLQVSRDRPPDGSSNPSGPQFGRQLNVYRTARYALGDLGPRKAEHTACSGTTPYRVLRLVTELHPAQTCLALERARHH